MKNIEIERKFLVKGDWRSEAIGSSRIMQGYIAHENGRTVRIRVRDEKAVLTIKGPSDAAGMSRFEWEREISMEDAVDLMSICQGGFIDKVRYIVPFEGHTFEVDEFAGANQGLVMAEVELGSEDEEFARPEWLGDEVTGDRRYYNSHLLGYPYCMWDKNE